MNESWLLLSLVFGAFGLGYFVYGKNQKAGITLVCGLALMIYPYLVSNTWMLVGIGIVLMVIPYFVRL